MNKMLVAIFNSESAAYDGLSALSDLHKDRDITLYATAVIAKGVSRTFIAKQISGEGPTGVALGILTGSLVGLLGGSVGVTVGASAGGLVELVLDLAKIGIGIDFIDEVLRALTPGKAAVLAEAQEAWIIPVNKKLGELGGVVYRRQRSEVFEDQMVRETAAADAELKQLKEELAQANVANKAAVQKEIDNVRQKLEATQTQVEARQEQARSEVDAKIVALRKQMEQASYWQEAKVEKHHAEVKEEYEARNAKLERAKQFIKAL